MKWIAMGTAEDNRVYGVRNDEKDRMTVYVEGEPGRWIPLKRDVFDLEEAADVVAQVAGPPFQFQMHTLGCV